MFFCLETIKPVAGWIQKQLWTIPAIQQGIQSLKPQLKLPICNRNHRYNPWYGCCKLSKRYDKLSSYIRSKNNFAFNREGYNHQFTSRVYKGLQTALGHVDTRSLDCTDSPGVSLALVSQPIQTMVPSQMHFPPEQLSLISSEVEVMLKKTDAISLV